MFAGHAIQPLSGGRCARPIALLYRIDRALHTFLSTESAAELIERMHAAGEAVESPEFSRPDGVFTTYDGRRTDFYPPGTYVVRETRAGCGVIWLLDDGRDA